jgi:hypothetical protein
MPKDWDIKEWKPYHTTLIRLKMKDFTYEEMSIKTGMKKSQVTAVCNTPTFKKKLAEVQQATQGKVREALKVAQEESVAVADAITLLTGETLNAVKKIVKVMKRGKAGDKIQLDAAKLVLEYSGFKPPETVVDVTREYKPEEIEQAHKTLLEVQELTKRLSNRGTKYVIKKKADNTPQVKPDIYDAVPESPLTDEDSHHTTPPDEPREAEPQSTSQD